MHNSFKKRDGSTHYTHIKAVQMKGYILSSINGGRENIYTADQICGMIDFQVDHIFVKFRMSYSSDYWNL